jgi:two-component system, LytTR family, response regulator
MLHQIDKKTFRNSDIKDVLAVPYKNQYLLVNIHQILYLEANEQYSIINTIDNKRIVVSVRLKKMTERLPNYFLRIHHSYIINALQATAVMKKSKVILSNQLELPISRRRKKVLNDLTI